MVKAKMLVYSGGFEGQRPLRQRAAASPSKFKRKLAKHKEVTRKINREKLQECGKKYFMTNACIWHILCLEGEKKKQGFASFLS